LSSQGSGTADFVSRFREDVGCLSSFLPPAQLSVSKTNPLQKERFDPTL